MQHSYSALFTNLPSECKCFLLHSASISFSNPFHYLILCLSTRFLLLLPMWHWMLWRLLTTRRAAARRGLESSAAVLHGCRAPQIILETEGFPPSFIRVQSRFTTREKETALYFLLIHPSSLRILFCYNFHQFYCLLTSKFEIFGNDAIFCFWTSIS